MGLQVRSVRTQVYRVVIAHGCQVSGSTIHFAETACDSAATLAADVFAEECEA
jgi:folate-dependent phosphoribosylglycinamide formyltransferase PurN